MVETCSPLKNSLGNKDLDFPDVWDKLANKKKEIILSKDDSNILERKPLLLLFCLKIKSRHTCLMCVIELTVLSLLAFKFSTQLDQIKIQCFLCMLML